MCNTNTSTTPQAATANPADSPATQPDKELVLANYRLQLARTRAEADYALSAAGQMQRQFDTMQRIAKPYAESDIVPKQYQGKIGNCVIACDLASRMNLPVLAVMQNLYIVNGTPGWSSKFLVATVNNCGRFTALRYRKRNLGPLGKVKYNSTEWVNDNGQRRKTIVVREYDATGIDNWECVAYATERATNEVLESDAVTIEMAIKEGWYTKDGSKWVTMPQLMLSYRAAAFWQRIYAPEISMGFRTVEEEEDRLAAAIKVDYEDITDAPAPEANTPAPEPSAAAPASKKPAPTSGAVEGAKQRLRERDANRTAATSPSIFTTTADSMPS